MSTSTSDSVLGTGTRVNGKKKNCQFELEKERDVVERPPRAMAEFFLSGWKEKNHLPSFKKDQLSPRTAAKKKKKFSFRKI